MEFASKGVATGGLVTGIIGTALGVLNGGAGLLGGTAARSYVAGEMEGAHHRSVYGCSTPYGSLGESTPVNRYELGLEKQILEKDSIIGELKAEQYTDRAIVALSDRVERRFDKIENRFENKIDNLAEKTHFKFDCVEKQISTQNVINAQVTANLSCMAQTVAQLQGLTKLIVPITSICPEPMLKYNSFTTPTTPAE